MVDVILNKKLDQRNIAKLELLGIADYAVQKAMSIYYERSEPSEKKRMGCPFRQLEPEYISAVKEIVDKINKEGRVSTVRSLAAALEEQKSIVVSYDVLLKDLHTLKLTYKKDKKALISVCKATTDTARQYSKEFDDSCVLLERIEDTKYASF
ncbi:hypothetical protein BD560DRAFT_490784 [Blakeslea trispora]|nr:hypothetical protein BD560DRAFT_490784 [Blakeslea trispora]